jgi:geranylgeranylglycerol-phosphate geranylgeranyltransferase
LSRAEHALMVAIAVLLGEFLVIGFNVPLFETVLAILAPVFITLGAFIYSDYHDVETDVQNQRMDRPLARGDIHPKEALIASIALIILGIVLSYFVNNIIFIITIGFAVLSILYAYSLKKIPLIGNILIALSMNIPFIYGNLVVSNFITVPVFFIALSSFFFGLGREIIKSIEDMYGDKKTGRLTLPMVTGIKVSEWISAITILLAIALHAYMFFKIPPFLSQWIFLIPVLIGNLIVAYSLFHVFEKVSDYRKIRNLTLIAPFFILIGIFLVLLF